MAVQDEVTWLLETIRDEWPGGIPDDVALRNRDDATTWYPDPTWTDGQDEVREQAADIDRYIVVGVASGSTQREFFGQKPQYSVQTTLDVRLDAKNDDEWGEIVDANTFDTHVAYAQRAINNNLVYPDVDPSAESIGKVIYLNLRIIDETNLSRNDKDYFRTDFTVELDGNQDTP